MYFFLYSNGYISPSLYFVWSIIPPMIAVFFIDRALGFDFFLKKHFQEREIEREKKKMQRFYEDTIKGVAFFNHLMSYFRHGREFSIVSIMFLIEKKIELLLTPLIICTHNGKLRTLGIDSANILISATNQLDWDILLYYMAEDISIYIAKLEPNHSDFSESRTCTSFIYSM
jgi:hypothetical protein